MESIIPLQSRTTSFRIASLPCTRTVYSLLHVISQVITLSASIHISPSSPLLHVECDSSIPSQPSFSPGSPSFSDSGGEMHSFTTILARLRLLAQRALSYRPGCGVGWMNMNDGKNEEGGCEGKRPELIVVRREGGEMWLLLTTCVGTGIDRRHRGRGSNGSLPATSPQFPCRSDGSVEVW
ncbi:hypothetical protein BKA83DRAFT_1706683 [Pisolithus microcarpus]|nr:hypothetical protein BKA83DRAFT_1706683 [Pisolithus microcarpus]